jgi:hypothetical protein
MLERSAPEDERRVLREEWRLSVLSRQGLGCGCIRLAQQCWKACRMGVV